MFSQRANKVTFDVFLQGMLVIPFPIGDDLLVEGILNTEPLPPLRELNALYHICPANVKFV